MKAKISADPPLVFEHHVRLPKGVANILRASPAHQQGITGKAIRIAVIDSGFFAHPFFSKRGCRIHYVPTFREPRPDIDQYGHGTAQLASIFALAPDAEVHAIKCMDRDPSYALEKALGLKPHVLSCAWGFNIDHPESTGTVPNAFKKMHRLLLKAIDQGICVVAAAGNGQRAFPGSMPQVISAGGIYFGPDGSFQPSDISSCFESHIFPGRTVPDVCGLVGQGPHGRLLLVPVPPRSGLARRPSFSTIAAGNVSSLLTSGSDQGLGWAIFSGTSAATAMISGVVALLLQKNIDLTPKQIKRVLIEAGRGVCSDAELLVDVQSALDRV